MATAKKPAAKKIAVKKAPAKKVVAKKGVAAKKVAAKKVIGGRDANGWPLELSASKSDAKAVKAEKPAKAPKEGSKMENAIKIFQKMSGKARKDVIAAFISEAGLTKAGAATYYGLVKAKLG